MSKELNRLRKGDTIRVRFAANGNVEDGDFKLVKFHTWGVEAVDINKGYPIVMPWRIIQFIFG